VPRIPGVGTFYTCMSISDLLDEHKRYAKKPGKMVEVPFPNRDSELRRGEIDARHASYFAPDV
jgi:hypothetical protein